MPENISAALYEKLDSICRFSDGYLIQSTLPSSKPERDLLLQMRTRNPTHFERADYGGSTLIRLTQSYANHRQIGILCASRHSNQAIAQRLVWTEFMLATGTRKPMETTLFEFMGCEAVLDTLADSGPIDLAPSVVVITDTHRVKMFKNAVRTYVPDGLTSLKARKVMAGLLGISMTPKSAVPEKVSASLIVGGIWPKSPRECHKDERSYPLFNEGISGLLKWKYDKQMLKSGRIPEGYKFGIYLDNGGQDGSY